MSARDVILLAVVLFAVGIGLFAFNFMFNSSINSIIANDQINSSTAAVEAFQSTQTSVINRFDYIVFGVFVGLILALIITSWYIGAHPIFIAIYFLLIVIGVTASTILANAWEEFSTASVFGTTVTSFPITNHLLSNLPYYIAVIGFLGIVVMFAKPYLTGD